MEKNIVIFGAGGFGREVLWLIEEQNKVSDRWNIMGFVDDSDDIQGQYIHGYPVVGNCNYLLNYDKELYVICCIGNSCTRKSIIEKISSNPNLIFPTLIAPDVKYSSSVQFGKGCIICASSILTVDISLGNFVIVNLDCTVGHDAVLNDYVTLYPSVNVSGCVKIGSLSEIGTGTNIIQGKFIGENSIVGAGSVVIQDIPNRCTAVGCPAKPIKFY